MAKLHDDITRYYKNDRTRSSNTRAFSLAHLVLDREDWARLQVMPNEHGSYDIVVRVDGGYGKEDAERVLRSYAVEAARFVFGETSVPAQIEGDDG